MKTHMNLATRDLDQSIAFYSTLLEAQPAKVRNDYALFITDDPGLELALDLEDAAPVTTGVHYGIFVDSVDDVERAIERLERAGLPQSIEREDTCCYANQTKVWVRDPEGRRWEVYTVHEDTEERNAENMQCCS
jgi:catechol 2,3-dioxygenase-like lactoylglutathione lyase family enzyme